MGNRVLDHDGSRHQRHPVILIPALVTFWAAFAPANAQDSATTGLFQMKKQTQSDIQENILNPILGAGRSSVLVDMEILVIQDTQSGSRSGSGLARRYKSSSPHEEPVRGTDDFDQDIGPDLTLHASTAAPAPKSFNLREQNSRQIKTMDESRSRVKIELANLRVSVLHDAGLPAGALAAARKTLLAVYGKTLSPDRLKLIPIAFAR